MAVTTRLPLVGSTISRRRCVRRSAEILISRGSAAPVTETGGVYYNGRRFLDHQHIRVNQRLSPSSAST